jgi:dipeptidyl-peptidase 4
MVQDTEASRGIPGWAGLVPEAHPPNCPAHSNHFRLRSLRHPSGISIRQSIRIETSATSSKQRIGATSNRQQNWRVLRPHFAPPSGWFRAFCALAAATVLAAIPALARPRPSKSLTVERIYSAPSLSGHLTPGIEWAPDSKRISYLERANGSVEMWTMDTATGERKVLVKSSVLEEVMQSRKASAIQSTGLGRVAPDNYKWSPTGDALLFIGSSDLVLLDLKTTSSQSLAGAKGNTSGGSDSDIEDPKFSPDGKWVSFIRDSNLWVASASTGDAKPLTTGGREELLKGQLDWLYPEEFDCQTAYWWSPDSTKIAYYEMDERPVTRYPIIDMSSPLGATVYTRYPQAGEANPIVRVGVVAATGGETKWMDTGANTDIYLPRVVWLADSRRVAIERFNRAQNQLDLLFADASTGASQTVLTDTDKYWINVADDLYFFSDNKRFLWSSERSGFRHYYLYDLSGRLIDQLTGGDWTVTGNGGFGPGGDSHGIIDEAHGYLYFLSNKDELRGTQLYRVSLRDKSIARISREDGVHDPLIAPDESAYVDTYSNVMTPDRQDLYRIDGTRVAAINENKVPELADYGLSKVEWVDVAASDGTKLCASIIRPPDFDASKKYPVLVDVYGGPQIQSVRDEWHGAAFLWDEMMAEKGYIVFSLDNRGSYFRGHAFETPIYHQLGKIELQDQLAGVNYLKSLAYVDPSRIGIWGWSYGGTMTLEAMFNASDVFKAGASVAPVSDWKLYDTAYTERYLGRPQDDPDGYRDSSPANQASHLRGKLLIAQATGDDNVHFANTSEVINDLILAGAYPDRLMIFPGRGHGIQDVPARTELFRGITEFLLNNL